jgi:23S rRNA pseudouridine2605 synthase
MEERLQKVMARAGVASRRASEELIQAGRVTVNGAVVKEMGTKVDTNKDQIAVDGKLLELGAGRLYYLLNKPVGVISAASDPHGRKTVLDLVPAPGRVYPVGRLDYDSEGLIVLTNDGALTERLSHARYHQPKTYLVLVRGIPNDEAMARLTAGIDLDEGKAKAEEALRVTGVPQGAPGMGLRTPAGTTWLQITMLEGRKHEVRRMVEAIGHVAERLVRTRIGPLELGDLRPGQWRQLGVPEIRLLLREVGLAGKATVPGRKGARPGTAARERRPAGGRGKPSSAGGRPGAPGGEAPGGRRPSRPGAAPGARSRTNTAGRRPEGTPGQKRRQAPKTR